MPEIPPPPQGSSWAGETAASSEQFVDVTLDMFSPGSDTKRMRPMEALHQSLSDSPEFRDASRKAAEEVRRPVAAFAQIPPECLAKPK